MDEIIKLYLKKLPEQTIKLHFMFLINTREIFECGSFGVIRFIKEKLNLFFCVFVHSILTIRGRLMRFMFETIVRTNGLL